MKTRKIAVIDYGTGNLRSVVKAFELLEAKVSLVTKPNEIEDVDAVVFPGQGSFDQCMSSLEHSGLRQSLKSWILEDRPFFGICLGLQVLFESSEEGNLSGLGLFKGRATRFCLGASYKIPHMGWNSLQINNEDKILTSAFHEKDFYFVHSYIFERVKKSDVLATTKYGKNFPSVVKRGNVYGVQFHPEKSHKNGLKLIKNFILNS